MNKKIILLLFASVQLVSLAQCLQSNNLGNNPNAVTSGTQLRFETTNTINTEFTLLEKFFQVDLEIVIMDFKSGPCYIPSLDLVIADKIVLYEVSNLNYGNERIKAILAHEFAHAVQYHAGLQNIWTGGKKIELHADFLAGYYMGQKGLVSERKLKSFADEFYDRGDPYVNDIDHHGTPEERRCAFLEGYRVAVKYNFNLQQAFNCGVDYIKLLYPCDPFGIIREYSKTEYNNVNYNQPTGSYTFKSSQKVMGFYNLYYQPLGYAGPGNDCVFNNLTPGTYVVVPGKVKKSGKVKYYSPYSFTVKPNHMGEFKINQVGMFAIRTYSISF
jgi:hypothetical protein